MPDPARAETPRPGVAVDDSFARPAVSYYRWVICGLLFFSTTVNYMDRQVISYLKEFFCTSVANGGFGWTNSQFSYVTAFFTGFYAGMTILVGWFIDKIGTKLGLALSLIIWSVFGMINAFAGKLVTMHVAVRSGFAIGEAGNFPASIKTVAEWFPKRERALATGIFNSGSNFGAMISALFVPWCLIHFGDQEGWKMAYILTGAIGFLWLILWFWLYETPMRQKRLSKAEHDYINSDEQAKTASEAATDAAKVPWLRLLKYRQTWAFFFGKFLTDGVWWFYLFWLPDYLKKQFGMTKHQVMLPTFIVYGVAIIGSVYGGSIPMTFMKRGMAVYRARMTAMLLIAIFPLTVLATQYFGNVSHFGTLAPILAISIICVGAAAHQAWSANLFTTVSDMFPKKAVASVTGIGAMAGGVGGVMVQLLAGVLTDAYEAAPQTAYLIMFVLCAVSYLAAWGLMKAFVPQHKPITDL
jgi:ACS family hexuronate transporter-like MFS transporter